MNTASFSLAAKKTIRSFLFAWYRLRFGLGARFAPRHTAVRGAQLFCTPVRPDPERLMPPAGVPAPVIREALLPSGAVSIYEWGDPTAQPTVLLVHGWSGWGLQFAAFLPPLLAKGMAVVAVDHVGHGRSGGKLSSLPTFIQTVRDVMERFPRIEGVIAHSLGAAAAAYVLAQSRAAGVSAVMIAPPRHPRVFLEQFAAALGISGSLVDTMQRWMERHFNLPFDAVHSDRVAPRIEGRTLVLHDPADEVVPISHGESYARLAPQSTLVRLEGCGHYKILRSPEAVSRAVGFLSGAGVSRSEVRYG